MNENHPIDENPANDKSRAGEGNAANKNNGSDAKKDGGEKSVAKDGLQARGGMTGEGLVGRQSVAAKQRKADGAGRKKSKVSSKKNTVVYAGIALLAVAAMFVAGFWAGQREEARKAQRIITLADIPEGYHPHAEKSLSQLPEAMSAELFTPALLPPNRVLNRAGFSEDASEYIWLVHALWFILDEDGVLTIAPTETAEAQPVEAIAEHSTESVEGTPENIDEQLGLYEENFLEILLKRDEHVDFYLGLSKRGARGNAKVALIYNGQHWVFNKWLNRPEWRGKTPDANGFYLYLNNAEDEEDEISDVPMKTIRGGLILHFKNDASSRKTMDNLGACYRYEQLKDEFALSVREDTTVCRIRVVYHEIVDPSNGKKVWESIILASRNEHLFNHNKEVHVKGNRFSTVSFKIIFFGEYGLYSFFFGKRENPLQIFSRMAGEPIAKENGKR